jgi:hypothetical protein
MKNALIILGIVAVALVLVGAFNAGVTVSIDLLAGGVQVSLFWIALAVAAAIGLAALAGWTLGRVQGGERARKLERELETTYRRLRESEARLHRLEVAPPASGAPLEAAEAVTTERPAAGVTAEQSPEEPTVEQSPEEPTVEQPADGVTVEQPAEQSPEEPTVERPAEGA